MMKKYILYIDGETKEYNNFDECCSIAFKSKDEGKQAQIFVTSSNEEIKLEDIVKVDMGNWWETINFF